MKRPHFLPFLAGFAIPLAFWSGLPAFAVGPKWWIIAGAVPLLAAGSPRLLPRHYLTMGLLLTWTTIGLCWSPDWKGGLHEEIHFGVIFWVVLLGASLKGIDGLLEGLSWGVILQLPLLLGQLFGWQGIQQLSTPPAGLFGNRDILGETAALLLVWAWTAPKGRWRTPQVALLTSVLLLSQSRSGIGAAVVGLLLPRRGLIMPLLLCCGLLAVWLLDPGKMTSLEARLSIWHFTLSHLSFRGSGLGGFQALHPYWEYAHSDGLQELYELGLGVGGASLLVLASLLSIRTPYSPVLLAATIEAAASFALHIPTTGFITALVAGHTLRLRWGFAAVDPLQCRGRSKDGPNLGWPPTDGERSPAGGSHRTGLVQS